LARSVEVWKNVKPVTILPWKLRIQVLGARDSKKIGEREGAERDKKKGARQSH